MGYLSPNVVLRATWLPFTLAAVAHSSRWVTGLVAVALATSSAAAAPVAARRAKVAPVVKAAAKLPVKPAVVAPLVIEPAALAEPIIGDETNEPPRPTKPQAEGALLIEYQRIHRDLTKLQQLRGNDATLELWPKFRAIKLAELCKTSEGRIELEVVMKELRGRIERKRGIELSAECLNNPLAASCN